VGVRECGSRASIVILGCFGWCGPKPQRFAAMMMMMTMAAPISIQVSGLGSFTSPTWA